MLEPSPPSSLPSSSSSSSTTKAAPIALLGPQKLGSAFFVRHFGFLFFVACRRRCRTVGDGAVAIAALVVSTAAATSSSFLLQAPLLG